jgi:hypothetical protein
MGPLVYYCRWQGAKLRLRGRDESAVWGLLITRQGDAEVTEPFRFDLLSWELWLGADGGRRLRLDELGVAVDEMPPSADEPG